MISEEIFYCDISVNENYPATKLKCYAFRCADHSMFVNGYYEFFIDQKEYETYHAICRIKTKDQENIWVENLYCAVANKIEQQYHLFVDISDEQGYWDFDCFPKFVFSYVYDAYIEI
jgi:hypothetical protein